MGRRKQDGLDYFPLDCGFFKDPRIRRLIFKFGADGALFYLYILASAYDNGFYVEYTEDFKEDAALDLKCSTEKIDLMLHYLLDKTLLDSTLFNEVKVLSSHGIQSQYQESKKGLRRDIEVDGNFWILDESETQGFIKVRNNSDKSGINSDKSGINSDKSGINATNKSKGNKNKSKGNESILRAPAHGSRIAVHPTFEQVLGYAKFRGAEQCARPFFDYYDAANWRDGQNVPVYNWQQKFIAWQMREEEKRERNGGRPTGKSAFDAQPTQKRIQENDDWLDKFLEEQRKKEEEDDLR